jgi:hypothetical protein
VKHTEKIKDVKIRSKPAIILIFLGYQLQAKAYGASQQP